MSRKWKRMIGKNQKSFGNNKEQEKKSEKVSRFSLIDDPTAVKVTGRSWVFPTFLIGFAIFLLWGYGGMTETTSLYWFTIIAYVSLGVMMFWFKRPYINIGTNKISSRRMFGEKLVEANEIESFLIHPKDAIIIVMRKKKNRWVFSRFLHRYDLDELKNRITTFASNHKIPVIEVEKKK